MGRFATTPYHRRGGVTAGITLCIIIEDRARNTTEESKGRHMAVTEGLADLRWIGLEKARIRVRQVHGKEMCLALDPGAACPAWSRDSG